ncbi:integral membrane protein [Colletotrichum musicola]|uniref:Integral membrane protein n=1 Tax=Colletotrichum musicola TaxID=2175873 RepID=A0A8H6NB71_9PEZI|nr:integral membrane protein [Colletotrichum musicola]
MATPSPQPEEENRFEVRKRLIFLLYPLIFVVCTAPLAAGRMVSSAGVRLSPEYLCFAGAMITSNGWLDVLVFSTTRRAILFDASVDEQSIGIETFNLTPLGQQFGHRVWITAGGARRQQQKRHERKPSVFRKASRHHRRRGSAEGSHDRSESQASLRGLDGAVIKGIQMETVTRIFVEVESPGEEKGYPTYPDRALSSMPSSETVGERVQQSMESYRDGGPDVPFRQIRANYDETMTVYQAYNTTIAAAAVESQLLTVSPSFKLTRMTWIKPSWAWMLYRSGYSYKDPGQERILALKMTHESFISLLRKGALLHMDVKRDGKEVRVPWDPERDVRLGKLPHRSIQIGIPAGAGICEEWAGSAIIGI